MQVEALLRLKRNRKLYRPTPAPRPGQRGAPPRFQGSRLEIWGEPIVQWQGTDEQGHPVTVQAWHHLHLRQVREVEVSVYRVLRERAKGTKRDPRESWFCWVGTARLSRLRRWFRPTVTASRMSTPIAFSSRISSGPKPG
jgi:hypothetical protein